MSKRVRTPLLVALLAGALALVSVFAFAGPAGAKASAKAHAVHASADSTKTAAVAKAYTAPPIKHVWVIMLENESYNYTFGKAGHKYAPYLTKTLVSKGALLKDYYGTGHDSVDNYTAAVSGQANNYELGQDCEKFTPFVQFGGENFDTWTKYDQLSGEGCVYPKEVKTIGTELTRHGYTWKEYAQDMGIDPKRDKTTMTKLGPACGHPKLNGIDLTDTTGPANDSYATRHNGFMYFRSIIDNKSYCDQHDVSFKPLAKELKKVSTTPNYSFITPNTCNDGHDWPKCQNGTAGRLPRVDKFLKTWVPKIMASPAYKQNGEILITFDESGDDSNAGSCCGLVDGLGYDDPAHPDINEPGLYGPGGGKVGAVVLSKYIKPGTVSMKPYNHFSQLKSFEKLFGLADLGDAKVPAVKPFGADVYTNPKG